MKLAFNKLSYQADGAMTIAAPDDRGGRPDRNRSSRTLEMRSWWRRLESAASQIGAFWWPARGSHLESMFAAHKGLRMGIVSSYGARDWTLIGRHQRLVTHSRIAETLGAPFDVAPGVIRDLVAIDLDDMACRITLDQASWLMRDGALTLSLWEGIDRLFSLSFTLGLRNGRRIAYVGGIQGRQCEAVLDRYRRLTKAAHGMRPRDLLFETFRMVCVAIDVAEIRAVSRAGRHRPWNVRRNAAADRTSLDYDAIWNDRGGVPIGGLFYKLDARPRMRDEQDVPARKRSLYRHRNIMLTRLAASISAAIGMSPQPLLRP